MGRPVRHAPARTAVTTDETVAQLAERGTFDAIPDLAQALPLTVVPDLVGWPRHGRDQLLEWASAMFEALGQMNDRAREALHSASGRRTARVKD